MAAQKIERLSPRVVCILGIEVIAARIGERMARAFVDVNFVVLAEPLQRGFETPDRVRSSDPNSPSIGTSSGLNLVSSSVTWP